MSGVVSRLPVCVAHWGAVLDVVAVELNMTTEGVIHPPVEVACVSYVGIRYRGFQLLNVLS